MNGGFTTEISEDFGFKSLFSQKLVNFFNEDIPFIKFTNFHIDSNLCLFFAAGKDHLIVGDLQKLRDLIDKKSTQELSSVILFDKTIDNILSLGTFDSNLFVALSHGKIMKCSVDNWNEWHELKCTFHQITCAKFIHNFGFIQYDRTLFKVDLTSDISEELLTNIASFDVSNDNIVILTHDYSIQVFSFENSLIEEFVISSDLKDEIISEYIPIDIIQLSNEKFLVTFGEIINEDKDDSDMIYDHKMFLITKDSFEESFDITPAFGTVKRNPITYYQSLHYWLPNLPLLYVVASSCSSEVSLLSDSKVIQPIQDSDRAILPINPDTENDTNPIGIGVDVISKDQMLDSGGDSESLKELPLIYILTNIGTLECWALFHTTGIKNRELSLEKTKELLKRKSLNISTISTARLESSISNEPSLTTTVDTDSKPNHDLTVSEPLVKKNGNLIVEPAKSAFGVPFFNFPQSNLESSFGNTSANKTTSLLSDNSFLGSFEFGQVKTEKFPTSTAFGKPSFGSLGFGKPLSEEKNTSVFDQTKTEQFPTNTVFGKPSFGSLGFNGSSLEEKNTLVFGQTKIEQFPTNTAFGKPSFGSLGFNESLSEDKNTSVFGQTKTEQLPTNTAFGKPSFGSLGFNESLSEEKNTSVFGQTKTEQLPINTGFSKPSFGSLGFNESLSEEKNTSVFGQPSFESKNPTFGELSFTSRSFSDTNNVIPAFGKPSFGSVGFAEGISTAISTSFGIPSFGSTGFETNMNKKSPFSTLNKANSNMLVFESPSFSSEQNNVDIPFNLEKNQELYKESSEKLPDNDNKIISNKGSSSNSQKLSTDSDQLILVNKEPENSNNSTRTLPNIEHRPDDVDYQSTNNIQISEEARHGTFSEDLNNVKIVSDLHNSIGSKIEIDNDKLVHNEPERKDSDNFSLLSITDRVKESSHIENKDIRQSFPVRSELNSDKKSDSSSSKYKDVLTNSPTQPFSFNGLMENLESKGLSGEPLETSDQMMSISNEGKVPNTKDLSNENDNKHAKFLKEAPQINIQTKDNFDNHMAISKQETIYFDSIKSIDKGLQPHSNIIEKNANKTVVYTEGLDGQCLDSNKQNSNDNLENNIQIEETLKASDTNFNSFETKLQLITDGKKQTTIYPSENMEAEFSIPQNTSITTIDQRTDSTFNYVSNQVQTDVIETCDFNVNSFENDEVYLTEQYHPKVLPKFYNGAALGSIKLYSDNKTIQAIETTYHTINAELDVLKENLHALGEYITDHSSMPFKRTEKTVMNVGSWRLGDVKQFYQLLHTRVMELSTVYNLSTSLDAEVKSFSKETVSTFNNMQHELKDYYDELTDLGLNNSGEIYDLSISQTRIRNSLRSKLTSMVDKQENIDELLRLLKLYMLGNKENNMLFNKLSFDNIERTSLLEEIQSLRYEISSLKIKDPKDNYQSTYQINNSEPTAPIAEAGLVINNKKQIGEFFKSRLS